MTHDYKRHGTTSLFVAMDVASGEVTGETYRRHRHQEVLRFFRKVEKEVPKGREIHIILDNYATHKHQKVKAWAEGTKRVHFHFIPTSSSWLNLVERFFSTLTQKRIRRGVFPLRRPPRIVPEGVHRDPQREPPAVRLDEVGRADSGEGGPGPQGARRRLRINALCFGHYTSVAPCIIRPRRVGPGRSSRKRDIARYRPVGVGRGSRDSIRGRARGALFSVRR